MENDLVRHTYSNSGRAAMLAADNVECVESELIFDKRPGAAGEKK